MTTHSPALNRWWQGHDRPGWRNFGIAMVVLSAAYPDARLDSVNRLLVYVVTIFTVFSAFHYSFTTSRRLSHS